MISPLTASLLAPAYAGEWLEPEKIILHEGEVMIAEYRAERGIAVLERKAELQNDTTAYKICYRRASNDPFYYDAAFLDSPFNVITFGSELVRLDTFPSSESDLLCYLLPRGTENDDGAFDIYLVSQRDHYYPISDVKTRTDILIYYDSERMRYYTGSVTIDGEVSRIITSSQKDIGREFSTKKQLPYTVTRTNKQAFEEYFPVWEITVPHALPPSDLTVCEYFMTEQTVGDGYYLSPAQGRPPFDRPISQQHLSPSAAYFRPLHSDSKPALLVLSYADDNLESIVSAFVYSPGKTTLKHVEVPSDLPACETWEKQTEETKKKKRGKNK
ncbi:hypothetical protein HZC31_03940 [Candidatus Woesearchaeota archaeon]|nr:hypothetical protein [Candidatus Woesearchaeota archaeon]